MTRWPLPLPNGAPCGAPDQQSLNRKLAEQLQAEQNSFAACAMTHYFARCVRGFVAKQKPGFLGN